MDLSRDELNDLVSDIMDTEGGAVISLPTPPDPDFGDLLTGQSLLKIPEPLDPDLVDMTDCFNNALDLHEVFSGGATNLSALSLKDIRMLKRVIGILRKIDVPLDVLIRLPEKELVFGCNTVLYAFCRNLLGKTALSWIPKPLIQIPAKTVTYAVMPPCVAEGDVNPKMHTVTALWPCSKTCADISFLQNFHWYVRLAALFYGPKSGVRRLSKNPRRCAIDFNIGEFNEVIQEIHIRSCQSSKQQHHSYLDKDITQWISANLDKLVALVPAKPMPVEWVCLDTVNQEFVTVMHPFTVWRIQSNEYDQSWFQVSYSTFPISANLQSQSLQNEERLVRHLGWDKNYFSGAAVSNNYFNFVGNRLYSALIGKLEWSAYAADILK